MKIKLYGVVGDWFDDLESSVVTDQIDSAKEDEEILVRINSPGGSALEGIAIYNALKAHPGRVTIQVDALAASAASIIAMAGDEIVMRTGSMMMIHDPAMLTYGSADQHLEAAELLEKHADGLIDVYAERTGKPSAEIRAIMAAESWYTAEEAVAAGFATRIDKNDAIVDNVVAFKDFTRNYKNVPQQVAAMFSPKPTANPGDSKGVQVENKQSEKVTMDAVRNEAIKAERERVKTINDVCAKAGVSALAGALISEGVDANTARARVIDALAEKQAEAPAGVTASITVKRDEKDNFIEGASQALAARAGFEKRDSNNPYNSYSLKEMARISASRAGLQVDGLSPLQMVGAVLAAGGHATSDFPQILEGTAQKALIEGYEGANESFSQWTMAGSVSDFRAAGRAGLGPFDMLDKVEEGSEFEYGTFADYGAPLQIATYGKLFAITRQAIINDDLGAFTRVPNKMGAAAVRTVGKLVSDILINNPTMADGVALFHANHGNNSDKELSAESLSSAKAAMRTQTDDNGNPLNIQPRYLVVPAALEDTARRLVSDEFILNGTIATYNPNRGLAEVIVDPRLDGDATNPLAWYLVSDQAFIEVAYLNGVQTPYLESREGWNVDGREYKVRIDAGAAPLDYRTAFRGTGQNP